MWVQYLYMMLRRKEYEIRSEPRSRLPPCRSYCSSTAAKFKFMLAANGYCGIIPIPAAFLLRHIWCTHSQRKDTFLHLQLTPHTCPHRAVQKHSSSTDSTSKLSSQASLTLVYIQAPCFFRSVWKYIRPHAVSSGLWHKARKNKVEMDCCMTTLPDRLAPKVKRSIMQRWNLSSSAHNISKSQNWLEQF